MTEIHKFMNWNKLQSYNLRREMLLQVQEKDMQL